MITAGYPGEIHIAFVHTDLFNLFRKCPKILHESPALLTVHFMIRRIHCKIRALTKGIRNGFPRADAIPFCRRGFCENYAMTGFLVPADDRRYLAQIHCGSVFQLFYRGPAKIS